MKRVGLTGGIGSGKSTVAELLGMRGARIIDADAISRSVTAAGGLAIRPITEQLGAGFIGADGALDRDRMRRASFADDKVRKLLESIVHPLVGQQSALQEQAALQAGCPCVVFDIPLLVESGRWRQRLDLVLVVDCPEQMQITRVTARSGLDAGAVMKIIAAQASRRQRLGAADLVIFNGGDSKQVLEHEVAQVARRLGL